MERKPLLSLLGLIVAAIVLAGCAGLGGSQRAAWRGAADRQCVASGAVKPTVWVRPMRPINGPSICGLDSPYQVIRLNGGRVALSQPAVVSCSMVPALERWSYSYLQPAARSLFNAEVVQIKTFGGYNCRGVNSARRGALSEHGFGNAIDISGFVLSDGRTIMVRSGWRGGSPDEQQFLRYAQRSACTIFRTVIGPDGDAAHVDHLHLDLARHDRAFRRHVCS